MKVQTGWNDERAQILVNINVREKSKYFLALGNCAIFGTGDVYGYRVQLRAFIKGF